MTAVNFQAYSPSLDQCCGHGHHSPASAKRCAEHLGWEDARIKVVPRNSYRKKGGNDLPEYDRRSGFDAEYDVHVSLRVRADSERELNDLMDRWVFSYSGSKNFISMDVIGVRRRIE